jgi:hypothetical protein
MTAQEIRDAVDASQDIGEGSEIHGWLETALAKGGDPVRNVRAEMARRQHIHAKLRQYDRIPELKALQALVV